MLLICTSCERNEEVSLDIPIVMCLPVSSVQANAPMRRVPGDPGGTEQFMLPRYAYIFIMQKIDENWRMINVAQDTLDAEDWEKTRYIGYLKTEGDSIFKYTKKMQLLLSNKGVKGHVYGIVSYEALTFSKDIKDINKITDLDKLLELKFNSHDIQGSLQHIYSTPYNYTLAGTGEYYCAFDNTYSNVEYVNLLLYHVAAKVDIKWYVPEDMRIKANPDEAVRLTYMKAVNLFNDWAYCFRPMENTVASMPTDGHSIVINNNNEGLWWEGRDYFYTIPFTVTGKADYFPLQMKLCTNGTDPAKAYKATLNLRIDPTSPFVPWLRADFNINSKLAEGDSSTKDVN